jgi:uncharacterized protein YcbK (DUF882 family)
MDFDEQLTENFNIHEFRCHDGTGVPYDLVENVKELAENLQVLRDFLGEPVKILSGYRNPTYNRTVVEGALASQHMQAKAGDLTVKSKTPAELHAIIEKLISQKKMKQGGLGLYKGFVHYDVRGTKARWNG